MRRSDDNCCEKCRSKKKSCCGFLKFLAFCACVAALISAIHTFFVYLNEKDAQKNYNSDLRRFATCFNTLKEALANVEVHCVKLSTFFSAAEIDLRYADIGKDLTLDISGICSAVKILLPKNCNVVNVADCKNSAVEFNPDTTEGAPTVTFVGRVRGCAISFTKDV